MLHRDNFEYLDLSSENTTKMAFLVGVHFNFNAFIIYLNENQLKSPLNLPEITHEQ
jgi:hypothetical protein